MKLTSYWVDSAAPFQGACTGPTTERVDAAIVGGGLTGLAAARALAKKGANVALLEASRIGGGASARNGGMCNSGLGIDFLAAVRRHGLPTAKALHLAYIAAVDTVERIVKDESIDCDFKRTGKLKLASKPAHFDNLARNYEALMRAGVDEPNLVRAAELRSEIGSDRYFGGMVYPKSAGMHVGRFLYGLAEAACRRGARIYEEAPVTQLRRINGHGYELTTPKGTLRAGQVLIATGAETSGPLRWFRRRFVPVGSFIIVTEPLPATVVDALMPTRRMATDTKNLTCYFRITPDNRLLFGGRARFAMSNPRSDAKSGRILHEAMISVFPELKDCRIDYCWGGLVDITVDRLPRAGEHDGLYFSMGYSGHGTQMATHMGTLMSEIMNGRSEANIWRDFDWPAIPGHFGPPWFLPLVGAYYRLKDLLH